MTKNQTTETKIASGFRAICLLQLKDFKDQNMLWDESNRGDAEVAEGYAEGNLNYENTK